MNVRRAAGRGRHSLLRRHSAGRHSAAARLIRRHGSRILPRVVRAALAGGNPSMWAAAHAPRRPRAMARGREPVGSGVEALLHDRAEQQRADRICPLDLRLHSCDRLLDHRLLCRGALDARHVRAVVLPLGVRHDAQVKEERHGVIHEPRDGANDQSRQRPRDGVLEEGPCVEGGGDVEAHEAGVEEEVDPPVLHAHDAERLVYRALGAAQRKRGRPDGELRRLEERGHLQQHRHNRCDQPHALHPSASLILRVLRHHRGRLYDGSEGEAQEQRGFSAERTAVGRVQVELLLVDL
mmetsp:Transcript_8690/g.22261  ORF Transcript_8690/g.22261 Transcript_8690/m.22261 type:complete len:295 (-) Transcript_8690:151-1035(-)